MDPKQAELQKKKAAIREHIEKQMNDGVNPKEIYQELIDRKVPSKLAVELINQVIARKRKKQSTDSEAGVPLSEREHKIIKFIQTQFDLGKTQKDVYHLLIQKKVSKEEAISLVQQVSSSADTSQDKAEREGNVSTELPQGPGISKSPLRNEVEFVAQQIAAGTEMKVIVDQLRENGMDRNKAVDLVMQFNEIQSIETAGPTKSEIADLATRGRNKMLIGLAALVGGGLITAASYAAAAPGEEYILLYGPMIFGLVYAVVGLVEWLRNM